MPAPTHRPRRPAGPPFIVGIGGTARAGSSTDRALLHALAAAAAAGAHTAFFGGQFLARLPLYDPAVLARTAEQASLVHAVRAADGILLASPSYHGSVSGLVKNALDLLEDLAGDERPYLDGRAVGCIVTAYGPQAGGTTLTTLRSIVHALRGWPTPFAAALNTSARLFDDAGRCTDDQCAAQLALVAGQVAAFHAPGEAHVDR